MKETVDISDYEYFDDLYRSYYEDSAYSNIILFMLGANQQNLEGFKFYQNEYFNAHKKYLEEKDRFEKIVINPIM